jgi:hypothetical protein
VSEGAHLMALLLTEAPVAPKEVVYADAFDRLQ